MLCDYIDLRHRILSRIEKDLKPKRFEHTLGVESTAISLARLYRISEEDASIAALLHDIDKNLSKEAMAAILQEADPVFFSESLADYPKLWHAFAGAETVRRDYPEISLEIQNAVRYHTTGSPKMGTLEKIIFTADYIEPNRKPFPGLEQARETAFFSLDQGVMVILRQTIDYLQENHQPCHPLTLSTWEWMQKQADVRVP